VRLPIAVPFFLVTIGVSGYVAFSTGRVNGSVVFAGISAATLVSALLLLWRSVQSLFNDAPGTEEAVATGRRRKELEREKAALLKAIKELEFDHEMRKVSDDDFAEIGGNYRARAIRVMRQLEQGANDYERMVRDEVARLRRGKPTVETKPEAQPTSDSASAPPTSAIPVVCPSCAALNDGDAVFCKKCAHRLSASEGAA
jgi:hypothetical protein